MSEQRHAITPRNADDSPALPVGAKALAQLVDRCPACGVERLVRSELLRSSWALDREPIEEKSVVFGVAARAAPQAQALGMGLFQVFPKDEEGRESAHYREAPAMVDNSSASGPADLELVLACQFEGVGSSAATAMIRTKVNAEGGWHSSAPAPTMESHHWLAELAGCVWNALRTADQHDDDR